MEKDIHKLEPDVIHALVESDSIFDNGIYFFNMLARYIEQIKETDSTVDFYKKAIKALYEDNKDCFASALQYIEYMEFRTFLYKMSYFFVRGMSHDAFTKEDTFAKCNIPEYRFRFNNLDYTKAGVNFLENGNISIPQTPKDAFVEHLNYDIDYKSCNLLEIALFLGDNELIRIALNNEVVNFRNIEFKEPYLYRTFAYSYNDTITQYFGYRKITLQERYDKYLESIALRIEKNNSNRKYIKRPENAGIYNSFTGEVVRPRDDTYYIDDFR